MNKTIIIKTNNDNNKQKTQIRNKQEMRRHNKINKLYF